MALYATIVSRANPLPHGSGLARETNATSAARILCCRLTVNGVCIVSVVRTVCNIDYVIFWKTRTHCLAGPPHFRAVGGSNRAEVNLS